MSDVPIKVRNQAIEQLAAKVRNHPASSYDGSQSQDEVVKNVLAQELARLEDEAELSADAEEEQARLKADMLGLDTEEELSETDEPEDEIAARQAELRDQMRKNFRRGRWG